MAYAGSGGVDQNSNKVIRTLLRVQNEALCIVRCRHNQFTVRGVGTELGSGAMHVTTTALSRKVYGTMQSVEVNIVVSTLFP